MIEATDRERIASIEDRLLAPPDDVEGAACEDCFGEDSECRFCGGSGLRQIATHDDEYEPEIGEDRDDQESDAREDGYEGDDDEECRDGEGRVCGAALPGT